MDPLEEIKSKLDIVSFISEYIPLSRAGRNFKALCPFHKEKTPSFVVSPELGIWRCFGACGEGGDVFKFLMKMENLEFPEAVRFLAERTGVKITTRGMPATERERLYQINGEALRFYHYILKNHQLGNLARSYLKKDRGLEDRTIDTFGVGFAPHAPDPLQKFLRKLGYGDLDLTRCGLVITIEDGGRKRVVDRFRDRIIFPLRDHRGNVLGFSGRVLPPLRQDSAGQAKYINTPETSIYQKRNHLFGLDVTKSEIKEKGEAIVVEGEFDLLSCWQAGIKNVVAIKGSAFTENQVKLLSRFTQKLVLALDMDPAGEKATKAGLRIVEVEGMDVKIADLGSFKDPDEAVRADKESFSRKLGAAVDAYQYFIERAFREYSPKTSEGVRRISRELALLLENVDDAIVKAHYARDIAGRLGISQEAVLLQIERKQPGQRVSPTREESAKRTRRELLEENIMSFSLATRAEFILDSRFETLLTDNALRRIRSEVGEFFKKNKRFSLRKFIESVPPELVDRASALILNPLNADFDEAHKLRELDCITDDLETLAAQQRINELTSVIREKEQKKVPIKKEREEILRLVGLLSRSKGSQRASN